MNMTIKFQFLVFLFCIIFNCNTTTGNTNNIIQELNDYDKYTIGIIYDQEHQNEVNLLQQNNFTQMFNFSFFEIEQTNPEISNPVLLSLNLCDKLIGNSSIYSIVIILNPNLVESTVSISYLCAYYQIPIISLYARDAIFSDKTVHNTFIRMKPSYFSEAKIWIELIQKFQWKSINFVHSSDDEGKFTAAKFQYYADQTDIKVENDIEYTPNANNYSNIATRIALSMSKVILLQAKSEDAEKIVKYAEDHQLTEYGYVWIVCEEAFSEKSFRPRNGFITVKYIEKIDPLMAALKKLEDTFKTVDDVALTREPVKDCDEGGLNWNTGKIIYESFIKNNQKNSNDKSLYVEFDEDGNRLSADYEVFNVEANELKSVGHIEVSLNGFNLTINESDIMWPGGLRQKPDGTKWSMKLKIVTLEEKPFVFRFKKPNDKECSQVNHESILCAWTSPINPNETIPYCCYGYCINLIEKLSNMLSFEYDVYLAPDGAYGDYDSTKGWNGLMGEVTTDKADMILAPFTINPERATAVDFTKPYKYQGITILVKRNNKDSSLASFLQPFKETLWIMVFLSVHVVALVLYLLDRFSPFGRFKLSKTENTEEDALNLSRALWFTWGVLLNSGIGEGTPRSFSARVLGMVWAGFAMIIVASYTANLAAFLVLDRPEASISGINDARLRNPQDGFNYATVRGSSVEKYFKRQVELSTMYRTMENKNYNNTEEGLKDLKDGKIQAFIWDSARLEYEASKSCDFVTAGELFGRSSYGLAFKKGNPWLDKFSLSILLLHETGFMEDLDSKWILSNGTTCQERDSSPSTLGLTNMAGVFMVVAGGIVMGIFLIFIEIAYKKYKDKKVKQHEITRNAVATWRKKVEKRKLKRSSIDYNSNHATRTTLNDALKPLRAIGKIREEDSKYDIV